jgi:hypothetical protein
VSVPREYQDRRGRPEQADRRTPAAEQSQRSDEQLDILTALDEPEGFDAWALFEAKTPEDEAA